MIHSLHERIEQERLIAQQSIPQSIFLDFSTPETPGTNPTSWNLDLIARRIFEELSHDTRRAKSIVDSDSLAKVLHIPLSKSDGRIAFLFSPLEALSEDVARELLFALRKIHDEYRGRISIIAGGAVNLLHLTEGVTSPFNIAENVNIPPHSREDFDAVVGELADEYGVSSPAKRVVDTLFEMTGGEACLATLLLRRMFAGGVQLRAQDVSTHVRSFAEAFSNAPLFSGEEVERRRQIRSDLALRVLRDAIEEIESTPSWLEVTAKLSTGADRVDFRGGSRDLDMCLSLRRIEDAYTFANPFLETVLTACFTPLHVADCFVLCGEWQNAKEYYRLADERSPRVKRGVFDSSRTYTLTDLTFFAFERVKPQEGREAILRESVKIAYHVIGVDSACILEASIDKSHEWCFSVVARKGHGPADCCYPECEGGPCDIGVRLALRRQKPVSAHAGHSAVTPIRIGGGVDSRYLVLNGHNETRSLSSQQRRACVALLSRCSSAVEEAETAEHRDTLLEQQRHRLNLVHRVSQSLQQHSDKERTAESVLRGLVELGYPCAMVSLLDLSDNRVKAIKASENVKVLVPLTVRDMGRTEVWPEDDILVYVVKTGEYINVKDCFAIGSRCDAVTCREIDPEMRSQIVFPLRAQRGIGWKSSGVFGTLQILNPRSVPLKQVDQDVLCQFVDHAAVALANAVLFEAHDKLVSDMSRRLSAFMEAGAVMSRRVTGVDIVKRELLATVGESLQADLGSILMYDPVFEKLVYQACYGHPESWTRKRIRMEFDLDEKSTGAWVFIQQKSICNQVVSDAPYYLEVPKVKSNCVVPIMMAGQTAGILRLDSFKEYAFTDADLPYLEAMASLIGATVTQDEAARQDRLTSKIVNALESENEWSYKLHCVLQAVAEVIGDGTCVSLLTTPETGGENVVLVATTAERLKAKIGKVAYKPGEGGTGWVLQHRKALRLRGRLANPTALQRDIVPPVKFIHRISEFPGRKRRYMDLMAVPLMDQAMCIGVLRAACFVDPGSPERLFSHYDEELLELAARHLVTAIKHRELRAYL